MPRPVDPISPLVTTPENPNARRLGLRFGSKGTHTSRTMMLHELSQLLDQAQMTEDEFTASVVEDNVLGKPTVSTRRLTAQRLRELYSLDPGIAIFRVLRRLWTIDDRGRPLLALLCALARDPLLRASASVIIETSVGSEMRRQELVATLRAAVGDRLNDAVLDKVARNVASTWTQSGHLAGRVRKVRQRVDPTPPTVAFALWLGAAEGRTNHALLGSLWTRSLDRSESALVDLSLEAKRLDLIDVTRGAGVLTIDTRRLDPFQRGA